MADSASEVRSGILAHLRAQHPDICRHWFDDIHVVDFEGGRLRFLVQERSRLSYLRRSCLDHFNESAQAVTGRLVAVEFISDDEARDALRKKQPKRGRSSHAPTARGSDNAAEFDLNPDHTFDSFVHGPHNRLAFAAAHAVCERPGEAFNPLFVYGGVGLGKTHLLQAICHTVTMLHPQRVVRYVTCEAFSHQFMTAVQRGDLAEFRDRYRNVDVLAIDDIQFLSKLERSQEEFFHTFNALHQSGRQIVLSSDAAPKELMDLEPRLTSRFECGLPVDIVKPEYETRVAIFKAKAALRPLLVPDDVAAFVASIVDSNIRELEGAVSRLQAMSQTYRRPIDLALAKEAFAALGCIPANGQRPTVQHIIEVVCDFYGVKLGDVLSKRKYKSIAQPRQICMWLARSLTRYSLQEIGGYFGGRDHTTVLHAIRTIERRSSGDDRLRHDLEHLGGLLDKRND